MPRVTRLRNLNPSTTKSNGPKVMVVYERILRLLLPAACGITNLNHFDSPGQEISLELSNHLC